MKGKIPMINYPFFCLLKDLTYLKKIKTDF